MASEEEPRRRDQQTGPIQLDADSQRLQDEIDQLVRGLAKEDDREYVRRWRQIHSWAYNRTQGDIKKKKTLKKRLLKERGNRCEDCGRAREAPELQMHRLDSTLAYDRSRNLGYVEENVVLLCVVCHRRREGLDVDLAELQE
jgi:5-methylcytosine-specific restriction endonuclease McrA